MFALVATIVIGMALVVTVVGLVSMVQDRDIAINKLLKELAHDEAHIRHLTSRLEEAFTKNTGN